LFISTGYCLGQGPQVFDLFKNQAFVGFAYPLFISTGYCLGQGPQVFDLLLPIGLKTRLLLALHILRPFGVKRGLLLFA
jgi:hypothetical protein